MNSSAFSSSRVISLMLMQILHGDEWLVTLVETVAAAIATHYSKVPPLARAVYAPSGRRRMAGGQALGAIVG
jgi:hypothetical protein